MPRWALAARLLAASTCLAGIGQVDGAGASAALAALALVYGGWAAAAEHLAPALHRRLPRLLVGATDVAVLAVAGWLSARAGWPAAAAVASIPVVTLHGWQSGRRWGLRVAAGVIAVAVLGTAAGVGDEPLRWFEVAVLAAALVWAVEATVRLSVAEAEAQARADELESARRLLVRNVSHELRTPLTVIQGLLSVLFQRWDSMTEPQRLDLIDAASVNVASLDASVLHFIDAGELDRDDAEARTEAVDLATVVERVRAKLAVALTGYDLQAHLEVDRLWTDPDAVTRILEMFVENAARFSPVGSPIIVGARRHGSNVELSVIDRGRGIAVHEREHVFESFWRADVAETGVSRGAGLGLFIAKQLAERLGGEVGFHSVKGRGTKFFALVPDADPLSPPVDPSPPARRSGRRRS